MRALAGLLLALSLGACQTAPAPEQPPSYRLIDLTGAYAALFDRVEGQNSAAQAAAFKAEITPLFPDFYQPRDGATQADYDARIARSFARFPAIRAKYSAAAASFAAMLDPAFASFKRAFPDVAPIGDIYLLHSLGEMDGGTRTIGAHSYFVFGADVMAQVHTFDGETPFLHHELFHKYHLQFYNECEEVACSLWVEGLATYAASELNPQASDAQLLLSVPEPIRPAVDSNLTEAVCAVKARLDSREDADASALFSFDRLNERLPPRFAYYVGYLIAREAAKTRSTQALAHLSAAEARPVIDAAIARLAACP